MDRPKIPDSARLFDRIAGRYDLANRVLSLGLDRGWRRAAVRAGAPRAGEAWLDLAAGTGDMAELGLRLSRTSNWIACDPSRGMLDRLKKRPSLRTIPVVQGFAERLPFAAGSFDGATLAFGLRNFSDRESGLREIRRILKPGGRLALLEFTPRRDGRWGRGGMAFYLNRVLPLAGGAISGRPAEYRYLAESSNAFWTAEELGRKLERAGFEIRRARPLSGGIVTLALAGRP